MNQQGKSKIILVAFAETLGINTQLREDLLHI